MVKFLSPPNNSPSPKVPIKISVFRTTVWFGWLIIEMVRITFSIFEDHKLLLFCYRLARKTESFEDGADTYVGSMTQGAAVRPQLAQRQDFPPTKAHCAHNLRAPLSGGIRVDTGTLSDRITCSAQSAARRGGCWPIVISLPRAS